MPDVDTTASDSPPSARLREREDGKPTRYPIEVSMPGMVHLLTLDAARNLWRQLGKACTDADSANARAVVAAEDFECVSEDCEGYGWLVDPGT